MLLSAMLFPNSQQNQSLYVCCTEWHRSPDKTMSVSARFLLKSKKIFSLLKNTNKIKHHYKILHYLFKLMICRWSALYISDKLSAKSKSYKLSKTIWSNPSNSSLSSRSIKKIIGEINIIQIRITMIGTEEVKIKTWRKRLVKILCSDHGNNKNQIK